MASSNIGSVGYNPYLDLPIADNSAPIPGTDLTWSQALVSILGPSEAGAGVIDSRNQAKLTIPPPLIDITGLQSALNGLSTIFNDLIARQNKGQIDDHMKEHQDMIAHAAQQLSTMAAAMAQRKQGLDASTAGNVVSLFFTAIGAALAILVAPEVSGVLFGLLVAGIVATMSTAVMQLTSLSMDAAGTQLHDAQNKVFDISFAGLVQAAVDSVPASKDMSDADRNRLITGISTFLTIAVAIVEVAGGVAAMGDGAVDAASAVKGFITDGKTLAESWAAFKAAFEVGTDATQTQRVAAIMQRAATVGGGLGDIQTGAGTGVVAAAEYTGNNAKATQQFWNTMADQQEKKISIDMDFIKDASKHLQSFVQEIVAMVNDFNTAGEQRAAAA